MNMDRVRELNKARQNKRRHRIKQELVEILGGKCAVCGSSSNLEFDHIDSSTKIIAISDGLASRSEQFVREEAKKCQLLCRTCHNVKTKRCCDNTSRRLSDEDYLTIREMYANGDMTQNSIAKIFGISQHHVSTIVNKARGLV